MTSSYKLIEKLSEAITADVKKNLLEKYLMHSRTEEKIKGRNELYSLSWSGLEQPEDSIWIYFLISWMYKIRTCCECVAESLQLDIQGNLTTAL